MKVSVLFPVQEKMGPRREQLRDFVLDGYRNAFPDWQILEGLGPMGAFWNKGDAIANAFANATGDALIIADADSFVDDWALEESVRRLEEFPWVVPHGQVYRLNENATNQVIAGGKIRWHALERATYEGPAGGGIVVMRREAYEAVNGIDPRFVGWGGEDISFAMALELLTGPHSRVGSPLVHLQHPRPNVKNRGSFANEALVAAYQSALDSGDVDGMKALCAREAPADWLPPLDPPARFQTLTGRRKRIRIQNAEFIFGDEGILETVDPYLAKQLRRRTVLCKELS